MSQAKTYTTAEIRYGTQGGQFVAAADHESTVAALREELEAWKARSERRVADIQLIAKRLTTAEQHNVALAEAMERIRFRCESFNDEGLGMKKHSVQTMLDIATKVLAKATESEQANEQ